MLLIDGERVATRADQEVDRANQETARAHRETAWANEATAKILANVAEKDRLLKELEEFRRQPDKATP